MSDEYPASGFEDHGLEPGPLDEWHRRHAHKGIWVVARAGRYEIRTARSFVGCFDVYDHASDDYPATNVSLDQARRIASSLHPHPPAPRENL